MKYVIGFWALLPYLPGENLFIEEEEINILQAVVLDSKEINTIDEQIISDLPKKEWYNFHNDIVAKNRGFNN
tara:strand:+ start:258 stop:473 length:216 start_codon:yes stop_codon:yes gene_type:complete